MLTQLLSVTFKSHCEIHTDELSLPHFRRWEGILEDLVSGQTGVKKDTVKVPVDNPVPGDKPPSAILAAAPKKAEGAAKPAVRTLGLADGEQIAMNRTETPTRGRALTVLEQLLGNVGRGQLPRTEDDTPGQRRPD